MPDVTQETSAKFKAVSRTCKEHVTKSSARSKFRSRKRDEAYAKLRELGI